MNTVLTVEMNYCSLCSVSQGMQLTLLPNTFMQFVQPASQSLACHLGGQIHYYLYVPPHIHSRYSDVEVQHYVTIPASFISLYCIMEEILLHTTTRRKLFCISRI